MRGQSTLWQMKYMAPTTKTVRITPIMEPIVLLGCGAGSSVVSKRKMENQTMEVNPAASRTNISFPDISPHRNNKSLLFCRQTTAFKLIHGRNKQALRQVCLKTLSVHKGYPCTRRP